MNDKERVLEELVEMAAENGVVLDRAGFAHAMADAIAFGTTGGMLEHTHGDLNARIVMACGTQNIPVGTVAATQVGLDAAINFMVAVGSALARAGAIGRPSTTQSLAAFLDTSAARN